MCDKGITVLPATYTQTIPAFTLELQGITTLWLVLVAPTYEGMARLSFPGWLVTYQAKYPAPGIEPGHGHPFQGRKMAIKTMYLFV